MSELTSTTYSNAQTGNFSTSLWNDDSTPNPGNLAAVNIMAGIRFDLALTSSTVRFSTLTLNLTLDDGSGGNPTIYDGTYYHALDAWVLRTESEDAFGSGVTPTDLSLTGTIGTPGSDFPGDSDWGFAGFYSTASAPGTTSFTIPFGTALADPGGNDIYDLHFTQRSIGASTGLYTFPWQDSTWTGNLHVLVFPNGDANTLFRITAATLTAESVPWFTGVEASRPGSRGVKDMRTDLPVLAADLVEDGYLPGIWTVPEQQDPDDPRNIRPTPLPTTEGTVDDEVPV